MPAMISIGVIGTGFGATVHIPGFKKIRGVRVLGIAGTNYKKTKEIDPVRLRPHPWEYHLYFDV